MLTFFRRIRKGLLDIGAARKYLLYAIGEIALVVIGILIALQINNWNQERLNRLEEQQLLRLIYTEMGDYLWLQDIGLKRQPDIVKAGERLLLAMKNPTNRTNQEQIDRAFTHHLCYTLVGLSRNIY